MPNRIPTFILMCALICDTLATRASAGDWTVADVDSLPMDIFGRTVRAGRDLIIHTAATIGPDAPDPARRYSGNGLECASCHLDAGTKKFGLPADEKREHPPDSGAKTRCGRWRTESTAAWSAA